MRLLLKSVELLLLNNGSYNFGFSYKNLRNVIVSINY